MTNAFEDRQLIHEAAFGLGYVKPMITGSGGEEQLFANTPTGKSAIGSTIRGDAPPFADPIGENFAVAFKQPDFDQDGWSRDEPIRRLDGHVLTLPPILSDPVGHFLEITNEDGLQAAARVIEN